MQAEPRASPGLIMWRSKRSQTASCLNSCDTRPSGRAEQNEHSYRVGVFVRWWGVRGTCEREQSSAMFALILFMFSGTTADCSVSLRRGPPCGVTV